jgi:hypothetical protein
MKVSPILTVTIASDTDYKQLVAEIYCDGMFVALISQDRGPDDLILEFPANSDPSAVCRSVRLDWFVDAVRKAKDKLLRG